MSIYIDVLIVLNFYIDYILLYCSSKLCAIKPQIKRLIVASLLGAFSSLFIILPFSNQLFGFIFSAFISIILSLIAFGTHNIVKNTVVYYILNCLFSGISILIWFITKNNNIIINNNIVYFNISPIILILSTVIIYLTITIIKKHIYYKNSQSNCKLTVEYNDNSIIINCLIDTGNLLKDSFTDKPIIIITKECAMTLLKIKEITIDSLYNVKGFRLIPTSSINDSGILLAFKPNKIIVQTNNKSLEIDGMIAVSNSKIAEGYQGIVGTYALSLGEEYTYA